MAYKQPRVPELHEGESERQYLKTLILFLKEFALAAWKADTQREKEIGSVGESISYPVTSVNGETGDVELDAADVGARSDTWTPNAGDVGALPEDGTAADSEKLDGKTLSEIADLIYPVGSIYTSLEDCCAPASLIAGSVWERITNRFLLGASDPDGTVTYAAGATGGAATVTLTTNQIPAHKHKLYMASSNNTGNITTYQLALGRTVDDEDEDGKIYEYDRPMFSAGGGKSHNNMPPYLAVYMWKRVS